MKAPLISFVTHGRNDGFMGDFAWRVSTCINQIARNFATLGRLGEIEILVGDWGSEQKTLREVMTLEPAARHVTRFCTVPPAVAARLNRDGDYGYSPAANIPIRRASGKFIFSMDSDAWMPLKTAEYLLQIAGGQNPTGEDLDNTFFWASRQHIPYPYIATSPSIEQLNRYMVEQRDKLFWTGKCDVKDFKGGAVAIFGKRELFHAIRGYNEALVHWGWHDIDIHLRMVMSFKAADLWELGAEMFHMEHYPQRGIPVAGGRKETPHIVPTRQVVNDEDWGAINDPIPVLPVVVESKPAPTPPPAPRPVAKTEPILKSPPAPAPASASAPAPVPTPAPGVKGKQTYTDNGFWTPQTFMLQAIQEWFSSRKLPPAKTALSIDKNPTLDQILCDSWPGLKIERAVYPQHDVQRLQAFADGQFDVVYSHQVLEHVPKPWLAGQELVRVLKPGGIGLHTTCAFNPLHGPPVFNDYYRFFPDGLAELFSNVTIHVKAGWGNREALITNLAINDGHGDLGGRRFHPLVGQRNEERYPWHTWIIFQKQGR